MRLLKPVWVSHGDGNPIFSIDIHPDDSRVATGGQGNDCGKVIIWNMAPIRDEKEEADENVPRILCQMDSHLGCVNCVRWSENGKYLASGGDDKLIMIWQISRGFGSGKSFGSNAAIVEHWRSAATLRGHAGDVLDLAWSPQDVWLASCSVDNTIVIWNALKFPEQVAVLNGHSGLVKGVTWDPVGKYLASQSDDKTLRLWRTSDWKEETSITSCFKECCGTTHVLRLNWSPDGNHIVSAHAMNNAGPTAQIVERNGWGTNLDFVGHRKAITVVRFNPKILSKQMKKSSDKLQQYSCCAIGSKDRSLSIWLTALKRPLVVMHDMFDKSILDISWSRTGLELLCCSLDGSVAYLGFDESEIGVPISKEEQQSFLEKVYGKSIFTNKTANTAPQIIESAAVLNLQQQNKDREASLSITSTPSKSLPALVPNGDMPFKPRDKQIETRTSDGRRRITPIFLAPQPDIGEVGIPAPYTTKSIAFKTTKETSKIKVEKLDRVTLPGLNVSSNSSHSVSIQSPPQPSTSAAAGGKGGTEEGNPPVSEGVDTVALVPLITPLEVDKPQVSTPTVQKDLVVIPTPQADRDKSTVNLTLPSEDQDKAKEVAKDKKGDEEQGKEKGDKEEGKEKDPRKEKDQEKEKDPRKEKDQEKEKDRDKSKIGGSLSLKKHGRVGRGRPRKVDREAKEALMTAAFTHATPVISTERDISRPVVTSRDLRLPVPADIKTTSKLVEGQPGGETSLTLEVENDLPAGSGQLHQCRCVRAGTVLWSQMLSSRILAITGSRQVTCVACEDKTVHIFGSNGKRLLPPLMLGSPVSVIKCNGHCVMAVTSHGYLYVWNMSLCKAVVQAHSLSTIMSGGEKIVHTMLTNEGVPLLTISSGKSYSFAPEIGTWMVVNDRDDRLQLCSDHHRCVPSRVRSSGPLAWVQGSGKATQQVSLVFQSTSHMQQTSTISHLETQMATCLALKSSSEYRFWLETYVRYLAQEGLEEKLRAVCDDLLGPVFRSVLPALSAWQPSVLGLNKREFLKRILPTIGANLRWQRLYTEYQEQLEALAENT